LGFRGTVWACVVDGAEKPFSDFDALIEER